MDTNKLYGVVIVLSVAIIALGGGLYYLMQQENQAQSVEVPVNDSIEVADLSGLDADSDFADFDVLDIDEELTTEDEVDYAVSEIDDVLAELDEISFDDFEDITY